MKTDKTEEIFNEDAAATYDEKAARVAAMKDALHLLSRIVLADLPDEANILCVGSGTGAEIFYLASAFPRWTFTAVEPAAAMLDVCRKKAEAQGISGRCTFHEGYLDTLDASARFDAATSILVSQFLLDMNEREAFFSQIASHLKPRGYLINADLSSRLDEEAYEDLMDVWMRMLKFGGMNFEREGYGRDVAVSKPADIEKLIADSGFDRPIQFCQTLFIHGWYTRLKDTD